MPVDRIYGCLQKAALDRKAGPAVRSTQLTKVVPSLRSATPSKDEETDDDQEEDEDEEQEEEGDKGDHQRYFWPRGKGTNIGTDRLEFLIQEGETKAQISWPDELKACPTDPIFRTLLQMFSLKFDKAQEIEVRFNLDGPVPYVGIVQNAFHTSL
jgi:hypothetical protein